MERPAQDPDSGAGRVRHSKALTLEYCGSTRNRCSICEAAMRRLGHHAQAFLVSPEGIKEGLSFGL
jgi:hypothetical protein